MATRGGILGKLLVCDLRVVEVVRETFMCEQEGTMLYLIEISHSVRVQ